MLLIPVPDRIRVQVRAWAALSAFALLSLPGTAREQWAPSSNLHVNFEQTGASADARYAVTRILATADNRGLPFAVVDKKEGRVFVFESVGKLRGVSAAIIGLAPGDHSVPGIGERELSRILPHERTTPAGRFLSTPGRNLSGEAVVWIKYSEGLSIHRLRPGNSHDQRLRRLTSITPGDNRMSLGCVVVDVDFYEAVVMPVLGNGSSMVYVLPETRPVNSLFDTTAM